MSRAALAIPMLALVLVGWSAVARAQEQSFVVPTPAGFKVAFTNASPDGAHRIMEFVPDGQTVQDWRQMITVQHLSRLAHVDPLQFAGSWAQKFKAACPAVTASRLPQAPIDGHEAVRLYLHTPECGGRAPESVLAVVVKGRDGLHMVQHAWRPAPPTRQELDAAATGFDRLRLCDARSPSCPR